MQPITEIWQEITNYCDLITQIRLTSVCKLFHNNLYITELNIAC